MSLLDDLQRTVNHVGNAVGHAVGTAVGTAYSTVTGDQAGGQRIEHDIDGVSDAVFFDGTVQGTNPAVIHKYFNDGPGTKSYGVAEATAKSLQGDYDDYGTRSARVTALLEQGWSGQAAQQGLQSVRQSQAIAQSMSQHMAAKQAAYSGQMQVFDATKHSVLPMPENPPPATSPMSMDVVSTASGAVTAAAYQEGTKANQQAYSSYQPPTQSHASAIPKGDAVTPGQSNPTPGPTTPGGPGIGEPRSYSPTFGTSQDHHTTTGQPGSGVQQRTPSTVGNGGQPGGVSPSRSLRWCPAPAARRPAWLATPGVRPATPTCRHPVITVPVSGRAAAPMADSGPAVFSPVAASVVAREPGTAAARVPPAGEAAHLGPATPLVLVKKRWPDALVRPGLVAPRDKVLLVLPAPVAVAARRKRTRSTRRPPTWSPRSTAPRSLATCRRRCRPAA